ncbi:MAG TPA: GxxExxY protein [Geothrix sp.]|nr:GxxExxY protein [Geothrix sp.]
MDPQEHDDACGETGPYTELTWSVIRAGIEVQKCLGPGLLESAYEACLAYELELAGHTVERQVAVPIRYRDLIVPNAFRMDLLIDGLLVVELKVAEAITKEHEAQVLSYLRFSGKPVGLLMNFALQPLAKRGVRRFLMSSPFSASSV